MRHELLVVTEEREILQDGASFFAKASGTPRPRGGGIERVEGDRRARRVGRAGRVQRFVPCDRVRVLRLLAYAMLARATVAPLSPRRRDLADAWLWPAPCSTPAFRLTRTVPTSAGRPRTVMPWRVTVTVTPL